MSQVILKKLKRATQWVHLNVIKLSQKFGASFKGCDKEAFLLYIKIDQKRLKGDNDAKSSNDSSDTTTIPKEPRNLIIDRSSKTGNQKVEGGISVLSKAKSPKKF